MQSSANSHRQLREGEWTAPSLLSLSIGHPTQLPASIISYYYRRCHYRKYRQLKHLVMLVQSSANSHRQLGEGELAAPSLLSMSIGHPTQLPASIISYYYGRCQYRKYRQLKHLVMLVHFY